MCCWVTSYNYILLIDRLGSRIFRRYTMGQQAAADNNDRDIIQWTATREPRAGYHGGGPTKIRRENASACVNSCFDELIPNVEDACRQLQHPDYQRTHLWDLYCCDSVNCGVYIGSIGQSPNVDLIINRCQNIGYYSIEDPGPPASNYCAPSMPNTINSGRVTAAAEPSNVPVTGTWSEDSIVPYTVTPIPTSEDALSLAPTSSVITSNPIKTGAPVAANGSNSSRLSIGAKAAIGVFSVIGALAIIALVLFLFRRQRKNPRNNPPGPPPILPYGNRAYPGPNSGSGTPLITPPPSVARGAPLAPPAKLSDRRYLQPIFKPGAARRSASASAGDPTIPSSTITGPAQSKLKPLHERRATKNSMLLPIGPTINEPSQYPQSSVYSLSARGASTVTVASNKAGSMHSGSATIAGTGTPPVSPRFPRAHDGARQSSDFVTPAGPPPNRALPAPPPTHPNSPTFSVSPVSPQSPTFPGRTHHRGDSYMAHSQNSRSVTPTVTTTTKELRDLTESYARETRESWGSWSGVGGGGPGVSPVGRKRRSRSPRGSTRGSTERSREAKNSVTLQELDLETLSGRY